MPKRSPLYVLSNCIKINSKYDLILILDNFEKTKTRLITLTYTQSVHTCFHEWHCIFYECHN